MVSRGGRGGAAARSFFSRKGAKWYKTLRVVSRRSVACVGGSSFLISFHEADGEVQRVLGKNDSRCSVAGAAGNFG